MALTAAEKNSTFVGLKQLIDPRLSDFEKGIVLDSFLTASHIGEATTSGAETLSNKTLTAPILTTPVFSSSPTGDGVTQWAEVSITNAEMLALRATPKTLVAAPGTGKVLEFVAAQLFFDRTAVYTESTDNMAIRFNNTTGVLVSQAIESTGFVDAAADAVQNALPKIDALTVAAGAVNLPLVLHNTGDGEFGGGNAANVVRVKIAYRVWTTGF
jgi:hypothetical protein